MLNQLNAKQKQSNYELSTTKLPNKRQNTTVSNTEQTKIDQFTNFIPQLRTPELGSVYGGRNILNLKAQKCQE